MSKNIRDFRELRVYQDAVDTAMSLFTITKGWPYEEKYSMIDQIRRSSRSVCANLAEGWRTRRYKAAFIAKLSDAESEAAETLVWLELAFRCGYLDDNKKKELEDSYDRILGRLVNMIHNASDWIIRSK